jgi:hypothetical protein
LNTTPSKVLPYVDGNHAGLSLSDLHRVTEPTLDTALIDGLFAQLPAKLRRTTWFENPLVSASLGGRPREA